MKSAVAKGQDRNPGTALQFWKIHRRKLEMILVLLIPFSWLGSLLFLSDKRPLQLAGHPEFGNQRTKKWLEDLGKLPDLDRLSRAGVLPQQAAMARDPFLFDLIRGVEVWEVEQQPKPQPTAAQLEEEDRAREFANHPAGIRYLGYIKTRKEVLLGAFILQEEPILLPIGDPKFKGWRLKNVDDSGATFQNLKYPILSYKIEPSDSPTARIGQPQNQY